MSARTRVAAVIGDPIRHSLSPTLHNAAFEALSLDWVYVAFEVAPGAASAALEAMRSLGIGGLSVTMPHKTDVADACDELSAEAAALRSVNCVVPLGDGRLRGESTDGEGFARSLLEAGVALAGRRVLLLGAGGAARAVARTLRSRGAAVVVAARRRDAALTACEGDDAAVVAWEARDEAARGVDIIVNATPIGMGSDGAMPLPAGSIGAHQTVADLVVHPLDTPLLLASRAAGASTVDGLGMLVHQAALAFEHWTGIGPPVDVMRAAAERTLR